VSQSRVRRGSSNVPPWYSTSSVRGFFEFIADDHLELLPHVRNPVLGDPDLLAHVVQVCGRARLSLLSATLMEC
jgi:hypothetical protein